MRLLTLLSKKWKSTKRRFPQNNFTQTPVLLLSVVASFYSCIHQPVSNQQNPNHKWSLNPLNVFNNTSPEYGLFKQSLDGKRTALARIVSAQCSKKDTKAIGDKPQRWQTTLISPFDQHTVEFEFTLSSADRTVIARVDNHKVILNNFQSIEPDIMNKICEGIEEGQKEIVFKDDRLEAMLAQWLTLVAPDCQLSSNETGFRCDFLAVDPRSTEETLNDIRRTMVRSWSRQPYILTRRLSISITLANALVSEDSQRQLDTLCRIVSHGDPVELPLALASKRWQDAVCFQRKSDRVNAAQVGLAKALSEIEFLRQLFERTSKLGTLTIRIPRESAPTKDLWINLTPRPDVVQNLAAESESLSAKLTGQTDEKPKACWHPLFALDPSSLQIARHLDLTGDATGISCEETTAETHKDVPSIYLADSITSETEFVITNGHSKMLRLPAGSYGYEIRGHYEALGWEASPDLANTKGEITWANKHPGAMIRGW